MKYENVIFDMDDTLLDCSPFYLKCKQDFIADASRRTGIDVDVVGKILDGIDVACTNLPHGFGKERFPRSFAATSAVLDIILGNKVNADAADQSYLLGDSVFHAEYPLYPGVYERLDLLKNVLGFNLFLCTKGDYDVQNRKIIKNGLDKIFETDHIYIVPKKTGAELTRILQDHSLNPETTLMIGDSIRDDVGSALDAGITSVWVQNYGKRSWAYEDKNHEPHHVIPIVTDILLISLLLNDIDRHRKSVEALNTETPVFRDSIDAEVAG